MCHLHTRFTTSDEKMCINFGVQKLAKNKCSVASFALGAVGNAVSMSNSVTNLPSRLLALDPDGFKFEKYGGQA